MSKTPQYFNKKEERGSSLALYSINGQGRKKITVAVECRDGEGNVPQNAARNIGTAEKLLTFEKEFEAVAALAKKAIDSMRKAGPNNIEVEFGVELGGTAGIPFVTEGHANANFKITLKWDKNNSG